MSVAVCFNLKLEYFIKTRVYIGLCSLMVLILVVVPMNCAFSDQVTSTSYRHYHQSQGFSNLATRLPQARKLSDIPVPVDVITQEQIASTGEAQLGLALQKLIPSFNFSLTQLSDGTGHLTPATLRGLGPDQMLVLINGKRRHNSALVHVNVSVGRGTSGIDLDAIAVSAIKRVELLRDGAAAQYGSDAIAGVINIILKDHDELDHVASHYSITDAGDGATRRTYFNKGFYFQNRGFLYVSYEHRAQSSSNRAGLDGRQQYPSLMDGSFDLREFGFDRKNHELGDPDSQEQAFVVNMSIDLDFPVTLYGFLTYSQRDNQTAGFYRTANDVRLNPLIDSTDANSLPQYPDGFLPYLNTNIEDFSMVMGFKGSLSDWDWDSSIQYGSNDFGFAVSNSLNASHVSAFGYSPTEAEAGQLTLSLAAYNLDWVRQIDQRAIVAFGFEYKENHFQLFAGEPLSYEDYDLTDNNERDQALAGIQVFPGFDPKTEIDEGRESYSFYYDQEYKLSQPFLINGAMRYEKYSDFGETLNGKLAFQYDVHPRLKLRASVNTGFRAPSMQQLYFSSISTQLSSDETLITRQTVRNDSDLTNDFGIEPLKEERSINYAWGFVFDTTDFLKITADFYSIEVKDRIILSDFIEPGLNADITEVLGDNNIESAQFFLNAADTQTRGFSLSARAHFDTDYSHQWLFTAGFHSSRTDVVEVDFSTSIFDVDDGVFSEQAQSILEEWQPQDQISLSAGFFTARLSSVLRLNRYGAYTLKDDCVAGECKVQTFSAKWLADIQFLLELESQLEWVFGVNNIFGETPDENKVEVFGDGLVNNVTGDKVVNTPGVFHFSRRGTPFSYSGTYYYAGFRYTF